MALSEKKRKTNDKYIAEHYSQVKLSMPNDEAEELTDFINQNKDMSKAGFIRYLIKKGMEDYKGIAQTDREARQIMKQQYKADNLETIIDGVNFGEHIYIYGKKHIEASEWLADKLKGTTKTEEILTRLDCERDFEVIVSNERA